MTHGIQDAVVLPVRTVKTRTMIAQAE